MSSNKLHASTTKSGYIRIIQFTRFFITFPGSHVEQYTRKSISKYHINTSKSEVNIYYLLYLLISKKRNTTFYVNYKISGK